MHSKHVFEEGRGWLVSKKKIASKIRNRQAEIEAKCSYKKQRVPLGHPSSNNLMRKRWTSAMQVQKKGDSCIYKLLLVIV